MGTSKRERQKAGHKARLNVEHSMARRSRLRRRIITAIGSLVAVVAAVALFVALSDNPSTSTAATTTTTPTTVSPTSSVPAATSAAGKPCVPFNDTLPAGAPQPNIPVGPPPTSLVIEDLTVGSGTPVVATDTVTVNYIGVSCSTGKIFDSSWSRGKPATFGLDQVIPGWTQGLVGMKPGGSRQLVIPPDLGYGSRGQGSSIAPDETLIFIVDLQSATPAAAK